MTWHLLYCAPLTERAAVASLGRLGLEAFTPVRIEERRHRRSREIRKIECVLFSRYAFLREKEGLPWHRISDAYGVIGPLLANGSPAFVKDEVIADLRNDQEHGVFDSLLPDGRELTKGRKVRIVDGAFAGQIAAIASTAGRRAKVLLRLFGTTRCATVKLDTLRLVA